MIGPLLEQGTRELGLALSAEHLQAFELFAAELKKWNRKVNLTAINVDKDIAVKHFIDALVFAQQIQEGENVLDIGSGAGIPAIPLKIVKPMISVVSVDAVGKKILFQRHLSRLLGLQSFEALHARVESLRETHHKCFKVITSRAFSRLEQFVSLAAPLLADGGRMIAMKGPAVFGEMKASEGQLLALGCEISSVHSYSLPFGMGERSLIIITPCKVA
jgi:16S rRNA (guanine527-N7)-methyltransferase